MAELLWRLEMKRARALGSLVKRGNSLYGMAFIVFVAGVLPIWLFPPAAIAAFPPEIVALVALCAAGLMLAVTVVGIPASLVLF